MLEPYGIHWFRRDLRIGGNPALQENFRATQGRTLGFFCFDPVFLSRSDFSSIRFQFFIETLKDLKQQLADAGSEILVFDQGPKASFALLFETLKDQSLPLPAVISFNRDYEPFARTRDLQMTEYFKDFGIAVKTESDHVLIEPDEIIKESSPESRYQVFSPFQRAWMKIYPSEKIQQKLKRQSKHFDQPLEKIFNLKWQALSLPLKDKLAAFEDENKKKVTITIPRAGSAHAFKTLKAFKKHLENYSVARDFPGMNATSHLSIFLKNGSITIAQIIQYLGLKPFIKAQSGADKFFSELVWREFYYYILYHNPRVETETFQQKYKNLKWQNNESFFEKWKTGLTGYPIVDAGMRQFNQTGWMHNRVRMIVASFLVKDLLIDYRWGEKYFMEKLLDGDLAPNNGGWQWAASTGCDPQPYFRIFNPKLQSEKFDPEGAYIKKYVPELLHLSSSEIHDPPLDKRKHYPPPIVDHFEQKEKALSLFKDA